MSHQVLEVLNDSKVYRNRKKVLSANSGETYVIAIRKADSRWTCSCKGWIFTYQKKGGDCGHIAEIKRLFGDTTRSEKILGRVKSFVSGLSKGMDTLAVLDVWQNLKHEAEMLLLFYENEGMTAAADGLRVLLSDVKQKAGAALAT